MMLYVVLQWRHMTVIVTTVSGTHWTLTLCDLDPVTLTTVSGSP